MKDAFCILINWKGRKYAIAYCLLSCRIFWVLQSVSTATRNLCWNNVWYLHGHQWKGWHQVIFINTAIASDIQEVKKFFWNYFNYLFKHTVHYDVYFCYKSPTFVINLPLLLSPTAASMKNSSAVLQASLRFYSWYTIVFI